MRDGWESVALGDLASQDAGAIAIGPFGSRMKAEHYTKSGVSVIRGQDLTERGAVEGDFVFISPEFAKTLGSANLQQDDLVMPHRGAIGRAAIVPAGTFVMSTSLMRIRIDRRKALPKFVLYYLLSNEGRNEVLKFASTVGTPGIGQPLSSLKKIRIPLPPLPEQRRISGVLGAFDDLIRTDRRLASDLRSLTRAAFLRLLATPCNVVAAAKVIELRYGKSLPARERVPGCVAVVSSAGIVGNHDQALVPGPGVVVGRKGTVGSVTWVPGDFFPIDTTFFVETKLPMLFAFLSLERLGLSAMNTDSAVPGLNRTNALTRSISIPSADSLRTFTSLADTWWTAAQSFDDECVDLTRARDELLPLLMSGRVSVREVAA